MAGKESPAATPGPSTPQQQQQQQRHHLLQQDGGDTEDKENATPAGASDAVIATKAASDAVSAAAAADGAPSRYAAIASLDEAEESEADRWSDRTAIITKIDHERYTDYAREVIDDIVANVRTPEKKKEYERR